MKRRLVPILAFACALGLQAASAQPVPQDSPQTVKAAIPPQGRPTTAPVPAARPDPPQPPPRLEPVPATRGSWEADAPNVKIEVTISYQVGSGAPVRRSATLTVADQSSGSLRAGNQVAVPATTFTPAPAGTRIDAATAAPPAPMTSFNYRSVGMNLDARRVMVQGNKTRMDLSVEFSAVDEKTSDAGRPPSFPTFSQNLTLVLESGKPMVVAQSSDYVDGAERRQSVEVKATIVR